MNRSLTALLGLGGGPMGERYPALDSYGAETSCRDEAAWLGVWSCTRTGLEYGYFESVYTMFGGASCDVGCMVYG
jgi:hypothetical protein